MKLVIFFALLGLFCGQTKAEESPKGDLSSIFPILSWAIHDASQVDPELPLDDQKHINGNAFIKYIFKNKEKFVNCEAKNECEKLIAEMDVNPHEAGTEKVNLRQILFTTNLQEKVPFLSFSAVDRLWGIRSLLYVGVKTFQEKEDENLPWSGIEPEDFIKFLFKYAPYIERMILNGRRKDLAKFMLKHQSSFTKEDFDLDDWEQRLKVYSDKHFMMRKPCSLFQQGVLTRLPNFFNPEVRLCDIPVTD